MPITKSAIKKMRVDKRKQAINRPIKTRMKTAIKMARLNPNKETISTLYSALDRAVKNHITTRNTASRIKSRLNKTLKAKGLENVFAGKSKKKS